MTWKKKTKPTKADFAKWAKARESKLVALSPEWLEHYGNCSHQFNAKGICTDCGIFSGLKEKRK